MVCRFIIMAVLLIIEICESTTGEYKHTQQALTIGLGGVDGEGLAMGWMAEDWLCSGWWKLGCVVDGGNLVVWVLGEY